MKFARVQQLGICVLATLLLGYLIVKYFLNAP